VNIEIDRLRELVDLVKSANISELTVRDGEASITIRKTLSATAPVAVSAAAVPAVPEPSGPPAALETVSPPELEAKEPDPYVAVKATLVGTFHLGEKPGGEPAIRVGQQVESGQVVCTIESMKLIHEVHAPLSGTVVQILAEDGQPVEYGTELMLIERVPAAGSD